MNPMPTFEVYKNRAFIGTVRAVSLNQAVKRARKLYGRCEVMGQVARHADKFHGPDSHRTEGRAPCNRDAASKAQIESIRQAAIEEWKANA